MGEISTTGWIMSAALQREVAELRRELQQLRVRIFGGSVAEARACGAFRFPAEARDDGRVVGLWGELRKDLGPGLRYCGVYAAGGEYGPGDIVTRSGAMWHCNADTTDAPGQSRIGPCA